MAKQIKHRRAKALTWICTLASCMGFMLSFNMDAEAGEQPGMSKSPASWDHIVSVACGSNFTIGLRSDGRVAYAGDNNSKAIRQIADWEHVERIEVLERCYAVGYEENGGVRLTTINPSADKTEWDDSDVSDWDSVRQVYVFEDRLMGVRADGTLLYKDWSAVEWEWGLDDEWNGLREIQWGVIPDLASRPYGIREDGTLLGLWRSPRRLIPEVEFYEPEESGWHDITELHSTESVMYALRSDGRICAHSDLFLMQMQYDLYNYDAAMEVSTWTDVSSFHCDLSDRSPVALRKDGTVVTLKNNSIAEEISKWSDVREIIGYGDRELVGIRTDGTVLTAGIDDEIADEISSSTDVRVFYNMGEYYVALRNDGVVRAVQTMYSSEEAAETIEIIRGWTAVKELYMDSATSWSHPDFIVALRKDGTVIGAGNNSSGQLDFDFTPAPEAEGDRSEEEEAAPTESPLQTKGTCGENLTWTLDEDGCLKIFGTGSMSFDQAPWYPAREKITAVSIDGAETIESQAFRGCRNLQTISFGNGLKHIGAEAFPECHALTDIHFPDGLETIEAQAFRHCAALKELWFPDSLREIGDAAFQGCGKLAKVTLTGDTILKPADYSEYNRVFEGCVSLKSAGPIGSGCDFEFAWTDHIGGFANCRSLREVIIPDTVTTIDDLAFCGCRILESIRIPESVTQIGYCAFARCEKLADIELPKNLILVSDYMFYGCKSLKEIIIPEKTVLRKGAFKGCTALEKIIMPQRVSEESGVHDLTETFSGCTSLKEITLPEGIRIIPDLAFRDCTDLQSITLPASLEFVSTAAFMDCPSLQYVSYYGNADWEVYECPIITDYIPERCGYFDAAEKTPASPASDRAS